MSAVCGLLVAAPQYISNLLSKFKTTQSLAHPADAVIRISQLKIAQSMAHPANSYLYCARNGLLDTPAAGFRTEKILRMHKARSA